MRAWHIILWSIASTALLFACTRSEITLVKAEYNSLPGWKNDLQAEAWHAFLKSCEVSQGASEKDIEAINQLFSKKIYWKHACDAAAKISPASHEKARQYFEQFFTPYYVGNSNNKPLLTGYFIPTVKGAIQQTKQYNYPIYALPEECEKGPCYSRREIEQGALKNRDLEIVWLEAIDAFFIHIQGSAYVELLSGERKKIIYAGNNGHPYYAIGRWLIESGDIEKEKISMQSIKDWLQKNPKRAVSLMQKNSRYIFFSLQPVSGGIKGAQQTNLVPRRSLAIDASIFAYGTPFYVVAEPTQRITRFEKLMIAQDTGSAIKGPLRADIFFGVGKEAGIDAGDFAQSGEMVILLPDKKVE